MSLVLFKRIFIIQNMTDNRNEPGSAKLMHDGEKLSKYQVIEKLAATIAILTVNIIALLFRFMTIILCSLALALLASYLLHSYLKCLSAVIFIYILINSTISLFRITRRNNQPKIAG